MDHTYPTTAASAAGLSIRQRNAAHQQTKTETATARNRRVRREITAAMRARRINAPLCDFLQIVIDECHLETWAYHSRTEWAAIVGKSVSSVKVYIRVACELGYLRLDAAGRLYVVALEEPRPDAQPEPTIGPLFLASERDSSQPEMDRILPKTDSFLPPASIDLIVQDLQVDQEARPAGGGDIIPLQPVSFWGREQQPSQQAETMDLLAAIGCYPATVRKLGHLSPAYVRAQIDAARRCGRAHDLAAFVSFALEYGGVWETLSSWTGSTPPAKDPPPEPVEAWPSYAPLPTYCPTCGKVCPAAHEGHCTRCEPELFDPPAGGG